MHWSSLFLSLLFLPIVVGQNTPPTFPQNIHWGNGEKLNTVAENIANQIQCPANVWKKFSVGVAVHTPSIKGMPPTEFLLVVVRIDYCPGAGGPGTGDGIAMATYPLDPSPITGGYSLAGTSGPSRRPPGTRPFDIPIGTAPMPFGPASYDPANLPQIYAFYTLLVRGAFASGDTFIFPDVWRKEKICGCDTPTVTTVLPNPTTDSIPKDH